MPKLAAKPRHKATVTVGIPGLVSGSWEIAWGGGQAKPKKGHKKSLQRKKGAVKPEPIAAHRARSVFLRHRIGAWEDSGHGYKWRRIRIWLSSFVEAYLNKVQKVVYHYPPLFPSRTRTMKSREDKFSTATAAYADFTIEADVFIAGERKPIRINRLINVDSSLTLTQAPLE